MASSEYEGMKALYAVMPELVIEPISWGSYDDEPDTYFFICRFHEMSDDIPDVSDFPALLAEMHRRGVSKMGTFGFPLTTYGGRNPHYFPPSRTWEECFSGGLENTFNMEERTQGETEEMTQLRETIMTKIIPRLLRPLETEGRTLTPRLLHGDIWDGNASVDVNTGQPVIFDPTPLYAHNECRPFHCTSESDREIC
jgi:protein-ribulosamine 3-kinase